MNAIFGNHDEQNGFARVDQLKAFIKKPLAYARRGPVNVDGVGNYELSVQAPVDGPWGVAGADVFRMYFFDSHAYPDDFKTSQYVTKYDWIRPSQVAYYRQLSQAHMAANNSVPAILFLHIPLPEYAFDAPVLRSAGTSRHREPVQSSDINTHVFSSLVELGEVKAVFCGHDHVNDDCYNRTGVLLCYGGGATVGTGYYWRSVPRRARVIEWEIDSQNRRTIRSWRRLYGEMGRRHSEEELYTETRVGEAART